jgi:hypothetical protein
MLDDYFDSIYCINLPRDVERKVIMDIEFDLIGVKDKVKYIYAEPPHKNWRASNYQFIGEMGVTLSQLKAIVDALSKNNEGNILILEDDVTFINNINDVMESLELPINWDILYLGGHPLAPLNHYKGNLYSTGKFASAFAYGISAEALKSIAHFYIDRMTLPFPNACADNLLNDFALHRGNNSFAVYPPVVNTVPGWSTLRQGERDYTDVIMKDWEEYLPT